MERSNVGLGAAAGATGGVGRLSSITILAILGEENDLFSPGLLLPNSASADDLRRVLVVEMLSAEVLAELGL